MNKDGRYREDIEAGLEVYVVLKKDQKTGELTRGVIQKILTHATYHPHGIKVVLEDGLVGRIQEIIQ